MQQPLQLRLITITITGMNLIEKTGAYAVRYVMTGENFIVMPTGMGDMGVTQFFVPPMAMAIEMDMDTMRHLALEFRLDSDPNRINVIDDISYLSMSIN